MSRGKENKNKLTSRERELTAIGAAIASNCVPCIEYHIPLGRKVGLSDSQIREAVELADKVRRVPADKVLQTADALLEETHTAKPDANRVHLDNPSLEEDNEMNRKSCGDQTGDNTNRCGSEESEEGKQNTEDKPSFDSSKMMQMMGECCPEKMKDFSSMMDVFRGGCCASDEERDPKASGEEKPAA